MTRIILASKSAGRRQMLENVGLVFDSIPANIDERAIEKQWQQTGSENAEIALELGKEKALSVSNALSLQHNDESLIIGSDQILECEGTIMHKATSLEEAKDKLHHLSGKTHSLVSSVCLAKGNEIIWSATDIAYLTMQNLDKNMIEHYLVKAGQALTDCVGAYALESHGAWLFEKIEGNYFTILGMPLLLLLKRLHTHHGVHI